MTNIQVKLGSAFGQKRTWGRERYDQASEIVRKTTSLPNSSSVTKFISEKVAFIPTRRLWFHRNYVPKGKCEF